jgi:hypothetical protein
LFLALLPFLFSILLIDVFERINGL